MKKPYKFLIFGTIALSILMVGTFVGDKYTEDLNLLVGFGALFSLIGLAVWGVLFLVAGWEFIEDLLGLFAKEKEGEDGIKQEKRI